MPPELMYCRSLHSSDPGRGRFSNASFSTSLLGGNKVSKNLSSQEIGTNGSSTSPPSAKLTVPPPAIDTSSSMPMEPFRVSYNS